LRLLLWVQKLARSLGKDDSNFAPSADSDFEGPANSGRRLKAEADSVHPKPPSKHGALVGRHSASPEIMQPVLARQVQIPRSNQTNTRVCGCRMEQRHPPLFWMQASVWLPSSVAGGNTDVSLMVSRREPRRTCLILLNLRCHTIYTRLTRQRLDTLFSTPHMD